MLLPTHAWRGFEQGVWLKPSLGAYVWPRAGTAAAHSNLAWSLSMPVLLQVVAGLISEIVLCIKEVNQKTRVAAYELLVELAQTMHERFPPPAVLGSTEGTGGPASSRKCLLAPQ